MDIKGEISVWEINIIYLIVDVCFFRECFQRDFIVYCVYQIELSIVEMRCKDQICKVQLVNSFDIWETYVMLVNFKEFS